MTTRTLDRTSSVPFYSQIKDILIEELKDPAKAAELVLTEASLIKRFQVSRAPIRQALKDLADEGYVVRHRAKGTFPVRGLNVRLPFAVELGGINRHLTEQGLKPTSRMVAMERVDAPDEVTAALGLGAGTEMLHLKRVISAKGAPLVWVISYFATPPEFAPSMEELERVGTVFPLIYDQLGLTFTRGEQSIWASGASAEEAAALDVGEGDPVLVAVSTMFTEDGQPGGWRRAVHPAEDFKYAFGLNR